MRKNVFISLLYGLCIGASLCSAGQDGVRQQAEVPVKVELESISMERASTWNFEESRQSPLGLRFDMELSVSDAWRFVEFSGFTKQYLSLTDSSGKKLAPVEFYNHCSFQSVKGGIVSASIIGTAAELPEAGVSCLRLHGTLKIPLARQKESVVYELPLQEGAEIRFPLPGGSEDGPDGDIIVAPELPSAILSLKEFDWIEKDGKKNLRVKIVMKTESRFELESLLPVDEKGGVLKVDHSGGSSSWGEKEMVWEKSMVLEDTGNIRMLRFRLVYREPGTFTAVPVDMKVGMGGKIPEDK